MNRGRWLSALPVLLLARGMALTADDPHASWCIPAIQREPTEPTYYQPETRLPPRLEKEKPCEFLEERPEILADRLYREAAKLDDDGKATQAAVKFVALLEQCPNFVRRDDVVVRLNKVANRWLDEAIGGQPGLHEETRTFVIPARSLGARAEIESRAREVLETIHRTALLRTVDPDAFTWNRKPHDFPVGWDWLEDVLLEVEYADSGLMGSIVLQDPGPTTPSHWWFSPQWKRNIMMQLHLDNSCEVPGGATGIWNGSSEISAPVPRAPLDGWSGLSFDF
jgi:hypothetical protein